MNFKNQRVLIAYFSRKGMNYVNGRIIDLPVGNTQIAAEMIQEETGGDLFHIEANHVYPKDYTECTEVAQSEQRRGARPELTATAAHMEDYDVVFLGYPNWWGTMPMAAFTFLDTYDFAGKTIVPFCTHEGSGMGHSESDIKQTCPDARVEKGLAIHGTDVKKSKSAIVRWLGK